MSQGSRTFSLAGTWRAGEARSPRLAAGLLLAGLLLLVNGFFLLRDGVRLGGDSPTYIRGAEYLLQGRLFAARPGLWLVYESVIALCQSVGIGLRGVVAVQLVVVAIAAWALHSLTRQLAGDWAGFAATGLFVANPDLARFNAYILTDSLYTSLVIIAAWGIHRAGEARGGWYPFAALILLIAALLRPNGWFLVPIAAVYWIVRAVPERRARSLALGALALALAVGIAALPALRSGVDFEHPSSYLQRGDIVSEYTGLLLPMPNEPRIEGQGELVATLGYAIRHPWPTALLMVARVGAELLHIRPFYSTMHNALIVIYLWPLYILAGIGFLRVRNMPLGALLAAVIASHLLFPVFLGADWDGRYLLFTLPLIGVFSASFLTGGQARRV